MAQRPHRDTLDTTDELAARQARANERALRNGRKAKVVAPITLEFDVPARHNNLINRYRYACNVLLRLHRGTVDQDGNPLLNGWQDGNVTAALRVGPNQYSPASAADAQALTDRLSNGIWAAYLVELVDNVELVGSDKDKRLVRRPLERGGFEQINGRDWTKQDEAAMIFTDLSLPQTAFVAWLAGIRKPVEQGR